MLTCRKPPRRRGRKVGGSPPLGDPEMLEERDDLGWYARKADALRKEIPIRRVDDDADRGTRVATLLDALRCGGIKGSLERRTLYTRRLPPGCRGCLAGKGTNAYVTGLCTRNCFFCFNQKPRVDELVVHGIRLAEPEEAPEVVRRSVKFVWPAVLRRYSM